jgi:hypothetical protein
VSVQGPERMNDDESDHESPIPRVRGTAAVSLPRLSAHNASQKRGTIGSGVGFSFLFFLHLVLTLLQWPPPAFCPPSKKLKRLFASSADTSILRCFLTKEGTAAAYSPQVVTPILLQGWVSGTGGGITVLSTGGACIAPSGVQKERMQPQEIFLVDLGSGDCVAQSGSNSLKLNNAPQILLISSSLPFYFQMLLMV